MSSSPRTLLPYQARWVADRSPLKVCEKSRRIGMSWTEAYDSVMHAGANNGNVYYQSYSLDMTRTFISDCAEWATALQIGADAIGETLITIDDDEKIPAFRLPLACGREIVAMTSAPRAFRSKGKPGDVAVIDEAAFVDNLAEVLKAAMAFLLWGGTVHVLSTHNGEGSEFNRLVESINDGSRPGSVHRIPFDAAVAEGLGKRRMAVVGLAWSAEAEREWVDQVRREYGADAAEELDCVPAAGDGPWLTWDLIRAVEHADAGKPELYGGGLVVIGNDIARRRHLWVAWAAELVGDVMWTREIVEMQNKKFADHDAALDALAAKYRVLRFALDQTGMGEKPVEDAQTRYGEARVDGVLMSGARKLALATSLRQRCEDRKIRIPASTAVRTDLHAVRKVAGPLGTPRLVADEDKNRGHADRFWSAALACGAAELGTARYGLHRLDTHADLAHVAHRAARRPGAPMRSLPGAL